LAAASFLVRTSFADPLLIAGALRKEVSRAHPGMRVSALRTQSELNSRHTVRERLLASLALFFSVVALLLAAVGLHGVLDYSVLQRRREIGIRLAIGAPAGDIVRRVTGAASAMVLLGSIAGIVMSLLLGRFAGTLLYEVKSTEMNLLVIPGLAILIAGALACLPAVLRAVRIDPLSMLRSE
jgi:putative ABC transport system permease protein